MSSAARLMVTVALLVLGATTPTAASEDAPADVCLELSTGSVSDTEWVAVETAVAEVVASRSALFPEPSVEAVPGLRLDIGSGHPGIPVPAGASCLDPAHDWTARFGRDFLQAGAELMLAQAPTTPGIDSSVNIEWYPDETRLLTRLKFNGPLDIPNGTCWVDDVLTIDAATGTVRASAEQGVKTSFLAESACGRFFDHLPNGGAGEQAVTLLPSAVELPDASSLRFVAEAVSVVDDAVVVSGSLARD